MATTSILRFPSITATPQLPSLQPPARRRTTPVQGRALEILGHAIEYVVDSRLPEGGPSAAENQAIRVLMACSRAVFEDAAAVVPVHQRVGSWIQGRMRRHGLV